MVTRSGVTRSGVSIRDDGRDEDELAQALVAGHLDAFDDLYPRHVDAAFRVALAVTGNRDDAADAVADAFARIFTAAQSGRLPADLVFRPYLLRCVRNASVDHLRRSARRRAGDVPDIVQSPDEPDAQAVAHEEESLVYRAFRTLPERWQWALWLHVVEDMPPRSAATVLQTSANNASQLASRARTALAAAYLQSHVANNVAPGCEFTVKHMGSYAVANETSATGTKVATHLADCATCRQRLSELDEVGLALTRAVAAVPLPAGLVLGLWKTRFIGDSAIPVASSLRSGAHEVVATASRWSGAAGGQAAPRSGQGFLQFLPQLPMVERVVAAVAAGVVAITLTTSSGGGPTPPLPTPPAGAPRSAGLPIESLLESLPFAGSLGPTGSVGAIPVEPMSAEVAPSDTADGFLPSAVNTVAAPEVAVGSSTGQSPAPTTGAVPRVPLTPPDPPVGLVPIGVAPVLTAPSLPIPAPPTVDLPTVAVPTVAVPTVAVPNVAVPTVAVPEVGVPNVAVPDRGLLQEVLPGGLSGPLGQGIVAIPTLLTSVLPVAGLAPTNLLPR